MSIEFKPDAGSSRFASWFLPVAALLCLLPQVSSAVALGLGVAVALGFGNPYHRATRRLAPLFLTLAVTGLGAGVNLVEVAKVGAQGFAYTAVGICASLILGICLARWLKVAGAAGVLIAVGTAICGGSAIAAVAPVIGAKNDEVTIALGTVFLLNALALVLFPELGHTLQLTERQFGLWSALAIHDTSSVVGATMQYGPTALAIGTTVKLARALWIVPVTLVIGALWARTHQVSAGSVPMKKPWFILGFLCAAALVTLLPVLQPTGHVVEAVAKRLMVLTLLLIGSNLTKATLRQVGIKPLLQGAILWLIIAGATLQAVLVGWIA